MRRLKEYIYPVSAGLCLFALGGQSAMAACDVPLSEVEITSPSSSSTTDPIVSISGNATGDCLDEIVWSLGSDGGSTIATTSWDGDWSWDANGIELESGDNVITVTARDSDGNEESDSITLELVDPPSPPPGDGDPIVDHKMKITFYKDLELDRFNVIAYLHTPNEDFSLPCDEDVTISASVLDPTQTEELLLFSETIPAGAASTCSSKYRIVLPGPDLREVVFQQDSSTRVYLYVFARKGTYLTDQRATMTEEEFINYTAGIDAAKVTVQFGDQAWSGWTTGPDTADSPWIKQSPCDELDSSIFSAKVELRCNR